MAGRRVVIKGSPEDTGKVRRKKKKRALPESPLVHDPRRGSGFRADLENAREAEQERRLQVLEAHVLENSRGPDYEPDVTIKIAQLRHDIRVLEKRIAEQAAPALSAKPDLWVRRDAVAQLIKQAFDGMPGVETWNEIGTVYRKLLEGLGRL